MKPFFIHGGDSLGQEDGTFWLKTGYHEVFRRLRPISRRWPGVVLGTFFNVMALHGLERYQRMGTWTDRELQQHQFETEGGDCKVLRSKAGSHASQAQVLRLLGCGPGCKAVVALQIQWELVCVLGLNGELTQGAQSIGLLGKFKKLSNVGVKL